MWRKKKFIIIALLAAVVLVGSVGGVVLAQTGTPETATGKTLLARVAAILGVDQQKVEDAFTQAQKEMRDEALTNYLNNLVTQGKLTQEQADQYKSWWQAKPDVPILPGFRGRGGCFGFRGCPGIVVPQPAPTSTQ